MKLNNEELKIVNYLENNTSFNNRVSMKRLCEIFGLSDREVRDILYRIITSQIIKVGSDKKGYWIVKSEEELMMGNRTTVKRIKSSVERLIANGGNADFLHSHIKEMKQKYLEVPEGQISIYE